MNTRPGKFVHDAFREGIRLRPKTWGKKSRDPRKARREGKREVSLTSKSEVVLTEDLLSSMSSLEKSGLDSLNFYGTITLVP